MPYVHACGQSFTKKRPDFWKCFRCDILCQYTTFILTNVYIYIYYNKIFERILTPALLTELLGVRTGPPIIL